MIPDPQHQPQEREMVFRVRERRPIAWEATIEEFTPASIRETWSGETAETCLVIALLERVEALTAEIAQLKAQLSLAHRLRAEDAHSHIHEQIALSTLQQRLRGRRGGMR